MLLDYSCGHQFLTNKSEDGDGSKHNGTSYDSRVYAAPRYIAPAKSQPRQVMRHDYAVHHARQPINVDRSHFSSNEQTISLMKDTSNVVFGPWCVPSGLVIDLHVQVSTDLGASILQLFENDKLVAQSASLHDSAASSMSLIYKGDVSGAPSSSFAVKVLTSADGNSVEPLGMQLEYKLYDSENGRVSHELPACSFYSASSALDD